MLQIISRHFSFSPRSVTFKWSNEPMIKMSEEVVPTDVPAWWLLKKKNAMFYNGFGRGDFSRFLMASNLLTVTDTQKQEKYIVTSTCFSLYTIN
jgi:hypothetical protein